MRSSVPTRFSPDRRNRAADRGAATTIRGGQRSSVAIAWIGWPLMVNRRAAPYPPATMSRYRRAAPELLWLCLPNPAVFNADLRAGCPAERRSRNASERRVSARQSSQSLSP